MPDQLQLRGGTTTEHNSFTGVAREVTVDTTKKTLVVHDGSQAGGTPLMKESGATAASSVQIGTGGVERLKLTSSEVVFNETSTDTDFRIEGNGEANLFKVDAGTDLIGIGTSSPSTRLHVEGSQDSLLFLKSTDAGSGLAAADNSGSSIIQNIGGSFRVLTGGDPNVVGTASTEKFRITGGGNVGIGTASPQVLMHLNATNARMQFTDSSTGSGSGDGVLVGLNGDDDFFINNRETSKNVLFFTQGSERMRISSDGKVGIGTSSPTSLLHVSSSESVALFDGNPSTSNVYVDINAAANRRGVIRFQSAGTNKWSIGRGDSDELSENNFHISTGSSGGDAAKLVVTSSGKLGIGSSSPEAILHGKITTAKTNSVEHMLILEHLSSGTTTTGFGTGIRFRGERNNGVMQNIGDIEFAADVNSGSNISCALVFKPALSGVVTERMRIDSSGRLLIGKTSTSQTHTLQVQSDSNAQGIAIYGRSADDIGEISWYENDGTTKLGELQYRQDHIALRHRVGHIEFATTYSGNSVSERMRVFEDKLCIGTTAGVGLASSRRLQIRGTNHANVGMNILITANDSNPASIDLGKSRSSGNAILGNNDDVGQINFYGNDGSGFHSMARILCRCQGHDTSNDDLPAALVFSTLTENTTSLKERMIIDDEGIISTCSQNHALGVSTTASSGTNKYNFRGHHSGTNGQPASGTLSFTVWSNGNVENLNNSYGSTSDIKLKENIVDANSQWNDIKAIKIRNYNFKEETGQDTKTQIGLVAQELETVCPKLIYETPDFDDKGEDLGTTTKCISYSVLYIKAIKALQEAIAKIEVLETKVAALEAA